MSRRRTLLAGWALALLAMAVFAMLGRWQLGRMQQKQAMLDEVRAVLAAREAQPLSVASDPQAAGRYQWAAGGGRFGDVPAILLDNQRRGGRAGVRAYRVFEPGAGEPLLVELGWLPLPGDRALPAIARPEGAQHVAGLLSPPPSHGIGEIAIAAQPDGTLLVTALQPGRLREALGLAALAPRVLKLDPDAPLGHARDLEVLPNTLPPEKHLGYAVQWFGLALAVLATALILTFRKPRR